MRTLVFTGGAHADYETAKVFFGDYDVVIAADSGLNVVIDFGLKADYIVGDMDSLENRALLEYFPDADVRIFPEDKDFTDTELALQLADDLHSDEVILFGGGGSERMEHLVYFLKVFERESPPTFWVFDTGVAMCFGDGCKSNILSTELPVGSLFSVFSVFMRNGKTPAVVSNGLHWELNNVDWANGAASISNRTDVPTVELIAKAGRFLAFWKP